VIGQVPQEAEVDFGSLEAADGAAAQALEGDAHLAGDGIQEFPALGGVGGQIGGRGMAPLKREIEAGKVPGAESV
jgi:hypothetical protein